MFFLVTLLIFALLITGKCTSVHAFCPYAVVCFGVLRLSFFPNLVFLFTGAIMLGVLIGIFTMFFGRKFCGYICPLGTLQEYLFKLRSRKYRLLKHLPFYYEQKFNKVKYFILIMTIILVAINKSPLFMNFCPNLVISRLPYLILPGIIIWAVILIGGLLTDRFFCRLLCPYAAFLNAFQYVSAKFGFKKLLIRRNLEKCIDCCNCMRNCPMNIDLSKDEYIKDPDCIHCLKCAEACPKDNTINEEMTERNCYE